jgi:Domain of unknown function (DUF4232)
MIAPPKRPSQDELELLIKEARERQLRRRLLGAAAIAIAAAIGLSAYAFAIGGKLDNAAQPPAQRARASAPLCRASQLFASASFQGATQTMLGGVTFQNISGTACSLPGRRPQMSIGWHGKQLPTQQRNMATAPSWPRAGTIAPGATADVYFQWWSCGSSGPKAPVRPTFLVNFGHGLRIRARSAETTPAFCGGLGGRRFLDVSRALVNR